MFNDNFTVDNRPEIVEAYLEDRCEVLAEDLLKYYGQGKYYYHDQGIYSNITGNFTGNEAHKAMIQSWCDCHLTKSDHLVILPLTQVGANLASELGRIPGLQISPDIHQDVIKTIITNRPSLILG